MNNLIKKILVSGGGTGYLRPAPGTWGSLAMVATLAAIVFFTGTDVVTTSIICIGIILLSTIICIALGDFTEKHYGKKDPSYCTIDEWAGQAVAFIGVNLGAHDDWKQIAISLTVGFLAFRLFDITKPFPARRAEKFPKGIGVVADDLVAGVFANIATHLVLNFVL